MRGGARADFCEPPYATVTLWRTVRRNAGWSNSIVKATIASAPPVGSR